jgi:tetratricopeptide (TPR) repeat protein
MPAGQWGGIAVLSWALCAQNLATRLERGIAAAQKGDCRAAIAELAPVAASDPRLIPAHNALGICESRLGRPERATPHFVALTRLEPDAWQGWNNLGANYLELNRPAEAEDAFRTAAERNPKVAAVWFNLGSARLKAGKPLEAYRALDRSHQLTPRDAGITQAWLDTAGRLAAEAADLIESRRYDRARALLLAVRRPFENSGSWNNLLGYAEFKLGRTQAAMTHLQKALNLEPDNEDYLLDIGEFLASNRAYDQAAAFFEVGLKRIPASPRVRFGLAVVRILQNRREEATRSLEQILSDYPKMEAVYRALGECYEDAGNWPGLIELGMRLQTLNPANAVGWYLEGAGLERTAAEGNGSPLPAIAALRRAVKLDSRSSKYRFVLAKAHEEDGQLAAAVAELKQVIRLEPDHARAHYVLGRLYQRIGEPELARAELQIHSRMKAKDRKVIYGALLDRSSTQD